MKKFKKPLIIGVIAVLVIGIGLLAFVGCDFLGIGIGKGKNIELEVEKGSSTTAIVNELKEYGISPVIADPQADKEDAKRLYNVEFVDMDTIKGMDAVVLAVSHDCFKNISLCDMDNFFGAGKKILLDLKGLLDKNEYEEAGYIYWRL